MKLDFNKRISLFQLKGMQEVTKEVAHGKKITQMQINLVKLPYSAQKVLPYEYVYMHKKSTTQKGRLLIQYQPSVSFKIQVLNLFFLYFG